MPKVSLTDNRVKIHTGDWWRKYDKNPENFSNFRKHDVGRRGHSYRLAVQYRGRWVNYGWSFPSGTDGVVKRGRRLYIHDRKMWDIIQGLKGEGELQNYKVINKVGE